MYKFLDESLNYKGMEFYISVVFFVWYIYMWIWYKHYKHINPGQFSASLETCPTLLIFLCKSIMLIVSCCCFSDVGRFAYDSYASSEIPPSSHPLATIQLTNLDPEMNIVTIFSSLTPYDSCVYKGQEGATFINKSLFLWPPKRKRNTHDIPQVCETWTTCFTSVEKSTDVLQW